MVFEEREVGEYRIFAGAVEGPGGDGYTAALIVQRVQGVRNAPCAVLRDESLACGHRWERSADALAYAIGVAQDAIRKRQLRPTTSCSS